MSNSGLWRNSTRRWIGNRLPYSFRRSTASCRIAYLDAYPEEYFNYTSGRWLYNESKRLRERQFRFNVDELKERAATSVGRRAADVQSFRKLAEGGFNRTFEITMQDGFQVIARLPYPCTYPAHFSVASEVATTALVRSHGVPVPEVFSYATSNDNPVGSKYIVMEKANGTNLGDVWYQLSEQERIKVTIQVTKIEAALFSIPLPAYGSVYYSNDLAKDAAKIPIESDKVVDSLCIGPFAEQKFWHDRRDRLPLERGPFLHADDVFRAGAIKELTWMKEYAQPRFPSDREYMDLFNYHRVDPARHLDSLNQYLQIFPFLVANASQDLLKPTIRHPDLQPNNIFIADDFTITAVIDWQHSVVLPLLLQAGVPDYFQNFDDEESLRLKKPMLPDNLSKMNEVDRSLALEMYRKRQLHFYYFAGTSKLNKPHLRALLQDSTLLKQKFYENASAPWEGNDIPLRAALVHAVQIWPLLTQLDDDSVPECPITFSYDEIQQILRQEAEKNDVDRNIAAIRDRIGISSNGWTTHERYEGACRENELIKAECAAGEDDSVKKEIEDYWPFDDHEEDTCCSSGI